MSGANSGNPMSGQPNGNDQRPTCGAKTRSGHPCKSTALYPNGRCRVHGGATPMGVASANFRLGRSSKALPQNMKRAASEALSDPNILETTDHIAILDAYLTHLLGTLDFEEVVQDWEGLRKQADAVDLALTSRDKEAIRETWTALYYSINRGDTEAKNWGVVRQVIQERGKTSEREIKRRIAMHQMIPAEQAITLVTGIGNLIRMHVKDPKALMAIEEGVRALTGA